MHYLQTVSEKSFLKPVLFPVNHTAGHNSSARPPKSLTGSYLSKRRKTRLQMNSNTPTGSCRIWTGSARPGRAVAAGALPSTCSAPDPCSCSNARGTRSTLQPPSVASSGILMTAYSFKTPPTWASRDPYASKIFLVHFNLLQEILNWRMSSSSYQHSCWITRRPSTPWLST